MTTNFRGLVTGLWLLLTLAGCDQSSTSELHDSQQTASGETAERLALPQVLHEVSGLTVNTRGELLAIADEVGVVYRIDLTQPSVEPFLAFGKPPLQRDFEGIALQDDDLYLLDSKGTLYRRRAEVRDDGASVSKIKTGLSKTCEFEGLTAEPNAQRLWLLCKRPLKKKHKHTLQLWAWDTSQQRLDEKSSLRLDLKSMGLPKNLAPSGVAWRPQGGFLVVAAKQRLFLELSSRGELLRHGKLAAHLHPQAEGVVQHGAAVLLADEGGGARPYLTRYAEGLK